jgi:single-stranded-DNA-specific exonuclease
MSAWIEPQEAAVPDELNRAIGGHPLVLRALVRRGITNPDQASAFLNPACYTPASPLELPDVEKSAGRIQEAIQKKERICVWGDFDVDGQTATTILYSALHELGAQVSYHIPVREIESHGVNLPVLEKLIDQGIGLLLTCDTGITSHPAVEYANKRGVDVIVTDHHDLPTELPRAFALVNPKRLAQDHPLATLPGAGVAYKLAEQIYRQYGRAGIGEQFLDLVALGIVADVAYLQGDVRYLLQRGLEMLRNTHRSGLQMLMEQAGVSSEWLTEESIGFLLAPRLNALGRLSDANLAVEFLTTSDASMARILAMQLEGLNEQRKLLTNQVFEGAQAQIEADPTLLQTPVLLLAYPSWPAGVLGIVASRLVEHYLRPVILISAPPGEIARGSGRSVEGVNITAAISANQEMLAGFGGHPMAAGLSFSPAPDVMEQIARFRRALSHTIREMIGEQQLGPKLVIDGYLPLENLSLEFVEDMERLAPFGSGNPPLMLVARGLRLASQTLLGSSAEHLLLVVEDDHSQTYRVIWWHGGGWPLPEGQFDLAYRARASSFSGQREVQIEWVEARVVEEASPRLEKSRTIQVIDLRDQSQPVEFLKQLRVQEDGLQVWCEGEARDDLQGFDRWQLTPGRALAVFTIPPGPAELTVAIETVTPSIIYLFGVDPGMDKLQVFLKRLAGLVKHAISAKQGCIRVPILAAATAQRESAVRLGLAWLETGGHIRLLHEQGDGVCVEMGTGQVGGSLPQVTARLKAIINETAAYRAYFRQADQDILITHGS